MLKHQKIVFVRWGKSVMEEQRTNEQGDSTRNNNLKNTQWVLKQMVMIADNRRALTNPFLCFVSALSKKSDNTVTLLVSCLKVKQMVGKRNGVGDQ